MGSALPNSTASHRTAAVSLLRVSVIGRQITENERRLAAWYIEIRLRRLQQGGSVGRQDISLKVEKWVLIVEH
jgi:hypothetical protein